MPRPLGLTSIRILAAVHEGTRYGLDIVATTGMPSGTVYPTLARLRKRALVRASWEDSDLAEAEGRPRRRYYELTAEGRDVLEAEIGRVDRIVGELREVTG
jgi:DNA-binding PadR family transcriptional regulator